MEAVEFEVFSREGGGWEGGEKELVTMKDKKKKKEVFEIKGDKRANHRSRKAEEH